MMPLRRIARARERVGRLVAVGGVAIEPAVCRKLNIAIDELCTKTYGLTLRLSSCRFDSASTNEIPGRNPDSKSPRKHHVFKSLLTG
jgi:hypothetical protein